MKKNTSGSQGLKADPNRQADDKLRGYLYQIWHSVNSWLDLADDEILYLEGAEDFDRLSGDTATAVQVKDTRAPITLRSKEVNDAINHYWKLRTHHPNLTIKFRLLTRSKVGREKGDPFGEGQAGLHLWQRCMGNSEVIYQISNFLQTEKRISKDVEEFLKQENPDVVYEQLIKPISWETDGKGASFVEISISDKLVLHGNRYNISPSHSKKVVDNLLKEALMVATRKDNRQLTRVRFLEIFEEKTTQRVPIQHLRYMPRDSPPIDHVGSAIVGPSEITIQSLSLIQTDIPPLYPDFAPREDLVESISTILQLEGLAVIWGGAGMGKTTLAKLIANRISDSSVWVNCTKKSSSLVEQLLLQLANGVSGQSLHNNIVLDDLNLQAQQLRQYEEALGILVYRILEHGGKLIITSQHRLSHNLTRRLKVTSAVVISVPVFTISEIEQFAQQMGCPINHTSTWAKVIRMHTSCHPRLVHARLVRLREGDWKHDRDQNILETPREVIEEQKEARQLLGDLTEDQRELLYRLSLMPIGFSRACALNIGEIPEPIPHPGDILNQLVGPWIDPGNKGYYTISPLLNNAASLVWSPSKIKDLHFQIANSILELTDLTTMEAQALFVHSMQGKNKIGITAVINSLIAAPPEKWKLLNQEFAWIIYIHTNPAKELFPGETFLNHLFRLLQYRISADIEPEYAPKILQVWDKEARSHKTEKSYPLIRMTLATQALISYKVFLPVKQMVAYLEELISIVNGNKDVDEIREVNRLLESQIPKPLTGKVNRFSLLFDFILARRPFHVPILRDLIDALDDLKPEIRNLLCASFRESWATSQMLVDNVWITEAELDNPDWTRCHQVYDTLIERAIVWGFPHIAFAAARGKAVIQDEYLHNFNSAHKILQDIIVKVGQSPIIEEAQAFLYLRQGHYKEAYSIYSRILPSWELPTGEWGGLRFLEVYRRAAICAAYLNLWAEAVNLFKEAGKKAQESGEIEQYIGLYADAGFSQFKAGDISGSLELLNWTQEEFQQLPQEDADLGYFTLKKLLGYLITWVAKHDQLVEFAEPPPGFCSNPDRDDEIMSYPNYPIQYLRLHLAQMEYKYNLGSTIFERTRNVEHRQLYPYLDFSLTHLELLYLFKFGKFEELPRLISQLAYAFDVTKKHRESGKGIEDKGIHPISADESSGFFSVRDIIDMLVPALLVQISRSANVDRSLFAWRNDSLGLPIQGNMILSLDLIDSILSTDGGDAATIIRDQAASPEERLVAAFKIVQDFDTNPDSLFYAHLLLMISIIEKDKALEWDKYILNDLANILSRQWLEKTKFRATLKIPVVSIPQIEQACHSSEAGKKKIGQILLAAYQGVSVKLSPDDLQQIRILDRRRDPAPS